MTNLDKCPTCGKDLVLDEIFIREHYGMAAYRYELYCPNEDCDYRVDAD